MKAICIIITAALWSVMPLMAVNPHAAVLARIKAGGGGGGTSPGTTGLVAWYDFADATDADGATYDLTEVGSPSYASGPPSYGTGASGGDGWTQADLDGVFGNADQDWSIVMRFRGYTSVSDGKYVLYGNGGRTGLRWYSAGLKTRLGGNLEHDTGVAMSLNTWYTVVVTHDSASDTNYWSINGTTLASYSNTSSYTAGNFQLSETAGVNFEIDFCAFYSRELDQDEADWIYNSGGTRTYGDL